MVTQATQSPALRLSACVVHLDQQLVVTHDGERRRLTTREAELLTFLVARPSTGVSRDTLLQEVWGFAPTVRSRACDTTMNRLREKVERDARDPDHLLTEFGTGYRFEPGTERELAGEPAPSAPLLRLGGCAVDLPRRRVAREGHEEALTTYEAGVLECLLARHGAEVTRETLLAEVWEVRDRSRTRLVDNVVARLRAKLEADPAEPAHLITVRGVGYRLATAEQAVPRGVITLVHGHVAGAATLLAHDPAAWEQAVERAGATLGPAVRRHQGYVARRDGLRWRWAFQETEQAVAFCVDAQLAWLEADWGDREGWRARRVDDVVVTRGPGLALAVQRGRPTPILDPVTVEAGFGGPEVGRVQCLLDEARPHQIVVAADTWTHGLAEVRPLESWSVELPGLPGPAEQRRAMVVVPEGLGGRRRLWREAAQPWAPLPSRPGPLVGREDARAQVAELLADHPVVTVLGPGGMGKTRLALAVAGSAERCAWGELREARTELDVAVALGHALGRAPDPKAPPRGLVRHLAASLPAGTILVLDEAEGGVEATGAVVEVLIRAAPHVKVLVTSRRRLGLAQEGVYELGPLTEAESGALLRARLGADLDDALAGRIAAPIGGVPLALELAAARARTIGAAKVADRLADGLAVLRSARGNGPRPTLRATIDWSLEGLDDAGRDAFAALGALPGPTPLELAEAVVGGDAPLDALEQLAEHSLATVREGVVDQYAVLRDAAMAALDAHPERPAVLARMAEVCAGFGTPDFSASLDGPSGAARREELRPLLSHLLWIREATRDTVDADTAGHLAVAIGHAASAHGRHDISVEGLEQALSLELSPRVRAEALLVLGARLTSVTRTREGAEKAERAVATFRPLDDPRLLEAASLAAWLTHTLGEDARTRALSEELVHAAERHGNRMFAELGRARLAELDGDAHAAAEAHTRAAAAADEAHAGMAYAMLGRCHGRHGRYRQAFEAMQEAVRGHLAVGRRQSAMALQLQASSAANNLGDLEAARELLEAAATTAHQTGSELTLGVVSAFLGVFAAREGEFGEARELFDDAVTRLESLGAAEPLAYARTERAALLLAQGRDDEAREDLDAALALEASLLPNVLSNLRGWRAEWFARRGDAAAAEAELAVADALFDELSVEARATLWGARAAVAVALGRDWALPLAELRTLAAGRDARSAIGARLVRVEALCSKR